VPPGALFTECLLYRPSAKKSSWAPLPVPLSSVLGDTRQRLRICLVSQPQHLAKKIYRFPGVPSLPSTVVMTLGKVPLCQVLHSISKVTRIPLLYLFLLFHPNKQKMYHIIITYITKSSHTSNTRHSSQRSQSHKYHKIVHNTKQVLT
jgi:hypothetical protein